MKVKVKGAGGTEGGVGQFMMGFLMMCGGGYMLFNAIRVTTNFGMGYSLYRFGGGFSISSGMIMIPFMFGVGMIFYNSRNVIGWLLSVGSLAALVFGVISSIQFRMASMSAFDLIVILVLLVGGIGLFLRSLHNFNQAVEE
ncbi:MAG: hypothetical protein KUG82_09095 [Pseudomonadales bacterium]|nr:hypothetical protein [Pseudomonadales bacterium]